MTIAILSDTHGLLRPEVTDRIRGVERILHLGDVGRPAVLEELRAIAPVLAVRGNVDRGDWAAALPETATTRVYGVDAYLLHDLSQLDLDPAAAGLGFVFYGHTHVPREELRDGARYVNPGSIGPRRFSLPVSFALLEPDLTLRFVTLG